MHRFDVDELRAQLASMFVLCRVAFAASCCERLMPNYAIFSEAVGWGNAGLLRSAVDEVWNSMESGSFNVGRIRELIEECNEVIPDTEDFDSAYTSAALDAGTAIVDTLECCLDGDPAHGVDVSSYGRDTVDMFVRERLGVDSDPQSELLVATHPIMITELKRLSEDLETLSEVQVFDPQFVRLFRAVAMRRGSSIVDK